jgi:hypothetical protein
MAAVAARTRVGNKPRPFRHYPLRGLVYCRCGTRMRGEAHVQRGTERRYYRCPMVGCHARRCPADRVEAIVLGELAEAVLPVPVLDAARTELRRRLDSPEVALAGRQRARLTTRLEQLKKQHSWGDLADADYQTARDEARAALAALPDGDRIAVFDTYRARILALPDAIAAASPALGRSFVGLWSSGSWCATERWSPSSGHRRLDHSSKDSGCAPKGPRTPARCLLETASYGI